MSAKMKHARTFDGGAPVTLESAHKGVSYRCWYCSAEVRYNGGYESRVRGVPRYTPHYFKLLVNVHHGDECDYNVERQIQLIAGTPDDPVHQLKKGLYRLRLMFPESLKTTPPTALLPPPSGGRAGAGGTGKTYVGGARLDGYLNTAARVLKIRHLCDENADIEKYLVLAFDDNKVPWSDFYIEKDSYEATYARLARGHVAYPLALAGTVCAVKERPSGSTPSKSYWVVELDVPKRRLDANGVMTSIGVHANASNHSHVGHLAAGDQVIIFGQWQAKPEKINPADPAKSSRIKAWRNIVLKFSINHPKQIVKIQAINDAGPKATP